MALFFCDPDAFRNQIRLMQQILKLAKSVYFIVLCRQLHLIIFIDLCLTGFIRRISRLAK